MEEIPVSKRRKIEEIVVNILQNSDLETATEHSVRVAAARQLNTDLSDLPHKYLVRQVLESFLISTAPQPLPDDVSASHATGDRHLVRDDHHSLPSSSSGRVICKLSDKRNVAVHDFNGKALVSIRDYYEQDEKQFHSGRGMNVRKYHAMLTVGGVGVLSRGLASKVENGTQLLGVLAGVEIYPTDIVFQTKPLDLLIFLQRRTRRMLVYDMIHRGLYGISLTARQWSLFRSSFPAVEEAIAKLEAKMRSTAVEEQSGTDFLSSVNNIATQGIVACDQNQSGAHTSGYEDEVDPQRQIAEGNFVRMERNDSVTSPNGRQNRTTPSFQEQTENQRHQPQTDNSTASAFASQGDMSHNWAANFPQGLSPVMTTRLDGKNYHSWVHLMDFFLNRLKVGYVLKHPCPSVSVEEQSFEEIMRTKAAVQKWIDDEYICRHYILNSLCDNLFSQYSKKGYSAKELWEELKLIYGEEFGTVRSHISNYIHFQMADGISILEQVQELQRILNTIMASGIWVDENFHVSAIISKLPPSWKDYRAKLMHEDGILPYSMLMHQLRLEEESRNQWMKGSLGRNCEVQNPKMKNSSEVQRKYKKWGCYTCGKEGHISKHCPDRKFEAHGKENETVQPGTDVIKDRKNNLDLD